MDDIQFEANELYKSFGEKQVLKGITVRAESGKATGLLGRNGAGKTTTIRIVMGVFPPDAGRVLVDGQPIDREKMRIGYLPEERGLYPKNPIDEQLLYLARLRGMSAAAGKKSIKKWLARLDMEEYLTKRLDTLSKGNQQKIQLAAALVADPDFIILDEPFSGFDPVNAMLLEDVVKELIEEGRVVLFSSHQMNYVEEFCDDIAILNDGKIVLAGGIDAIKRSYDRKKIEIRTREGEAVARFLNERAPEIVVSAQAAGDGVLAELTAADQKNGLLLALGGQNFDLDGIAVAEPTLNDIFVQYTGEEEAEGGDAHEAV